MSNTPEWRVVDTRYGVFLEIPGDSAFGAWRAAMPNLAAARLCAAAPQLLAELRRLVERCDGEEGVRADGSNIDTRAARALLEKLEGAS